MATRKRKTVGPVARPWTDLDDTRELVRHHTAKLAEARKALETKLGRRLHWTNPGTDEVRFLDGDLEAHGGKPTTLSRVGHKNDETKGRYDLVPFQALDEVVEVLTYGAKKYGDNNWREVPDPMRRYVAAALRHLSVYQQGEKLDSESGESHLAHAVCSLLFALELDG